MKAGDFYRSGGRYLDRIDTFFDKAMGRNGKENKFLTDIGIVEVSGFTVTTKNGGKYKTSQYQSFHDMRGSKGKENSAKMLFDLVCEQGFRGQNNMEFTCNFPGGSGVPARISNRDIYLDLDDFVKTSEFGGQVKGGKKVNMGNQYEDDLTEALIDYCSGKTPKKYASHVTQIIAKLTEKYGKAPTKAIGEGGKNQKRPLIKKGGNIIISAGGASTLNIGSTLTDITLEIDGKPVYLSVKFGSTLSFFNCGVRSSGNDKLALFPEAKLRAGDIPKDGKDYLDMFGINYRSFLNVFENYGKVSGPTINNHIQKTTLSSSGKTALEDLIASGVGYGYWMCHYTGSELKFYEIDQNYMRKASNLIGNGVEVQYGGASGTGKRIDIVFETESYKFKFNIRNKSGGVYPTHTNGDYYKK